MTHQGTTMPPLAGCCHRTAGTWHTRALVQPRIEAGTVLAAAAGGRSADAATAHESAPLCAAGRHTVRPPATAAAATEQSRVGQIATAAHTVRRLLSCDASASSLSGVFFGACSSIALIHARPAHVRCPSHARTRTTRLLARVLAAELRDVVQP
eukprot:4647936-Prymnesium_polylepis.1